MNEYRQLSFWHETTPGSLEPRPALPADTAVDVAIVGAGYTGLWTAYYLLEADQSLRVALIEAEIAGFGASGRNGGWCSALYPVGLTTLARERGRDAAIAQYRAMIGAVDEVGRVCAAEGIDAHFARGGSVYVARSAPQLTRAREHVNEAREFGFGEDDVALLDADSARKRFAASELVGGTFTPHCAAIHPARLARGLADVVERRGAMIYEQTRAFAIEPGVVRTSHGSVRAEVIIRATEGYTTRLRGLRRAVAPVYSLIIATAPLSADTWAEFGLADRETFSDFRHLIIYGQRTVDNRLIFGGRGAPYHFGSRIKSSYDRVPSVFEALRKTLGDLFPVLNDVEITHRWGGALGIARDWHASVGLDRNTGLGWAGGYVGDGVSTTNLAGRTLADLVTRRDTDLVTLPWVGHRSTPWEPEPLRWLGANAALRAMNWADAAEARGSRPSRLAGLVNRLLDR